MLAKMPATHIVPNTARSRASTASRSWLAQRTLATRSLTDFETESLARWRAKAWGAWLAATDAVAANRSVAAEAYGRLGAALTDICVRDAAITWCLPGARADIVTLAGRIAAGNAEGAGDSGGPCACGNAASTIDDPLMAALSALVDPARAVAPDPEIVGVAAAVLNGVISHASGATAVPAFTVLALLEWWSANLPQADYLLDRALAIDPGYSLATLLETAVSAALPPGWIGQRVT